LDKLKAITTSPPIPLEGKSSIYFLGTLSLLMALTSLSTDVYLPAMPQMKRDLHANVELTITGFLIGFSFAQIILGPLSDKYGRKPILLIGTLLFILGSIGCAVSNSITEIITCRVIQALGACTGPMLSRAMVRDVYSGKKSAEMMSTLMMLMALAPIMGPLLGGQIIRLGSWHWIFWLLTALGVVVLLLIIGLKETLPATKRLTSSPLDTFLKYRYLLTHRTFMRYTLCVTFFYVGAYAFIAGSPFVYINYFGINPQHYGWLFALNVLGLMIVSFINKRLVQKYSLPFLLRVSTAIAMTAGLALALLVRLDIGGIYAIILLVLIFFSMNGVISATSTVAALEDVPEIAGTASALLGSLQYGSGILSTLLLSHFDNGTPWTMSWIIAASAIAAFLTVVPFSRKKPNSCI
jgi:DHA1 family bicyclomycin/chloramphenicol resistance-like MFS transporter